ncbi:MAG TPA: hypothetical protein DDW49_00995 [Deltaproteobacteria bacterium]|nr:MAG: hypothetical protein A2048_07580 [Deltaproteobacteria bacterium GWA2_45_12]HBF11959.1 hypothetical protein [Deltaproteobacteria bacterium]
MKKFFLFVLMALVFSSSTYAFDTENHRGFYFYGMGGFMSAAHDTNVRTDQEFGNDIELAYGTTFGWNIINWLAPELQFSYATTTAEDSSNNTAREHILTIRLNAKVSFLTGADFNKNHTWKIYPYAKVGGVAHALFVNASNDDDKVGAWGGGVGVGGGLEVLYKVLYLGIDISNDLVFLQEEKNEIAGVNTKIIDGGLSDQISVMGAVGVHF